MSHDKRWYNGPAPEPRDDDVTPPYPAGVRWEVSQLRADFATLNIRVAGLERQAERIDERIALQGKILQGGIALIFVPVVVTVALQLWGVIGR